MRILHFSDLHFGTEKNAQNWYSQVAEDLKFDLDCHHLDALIISGDIANKCAPDEYKAAERFLGDLCGEFGLGSDQIIIVPGNHDLSWTTAKSAYRPVRREDYKGPLDENCAICGDEFVEVLDEELYKRRFQDFSTFYQNIKSEPYPLEYDEQGIIYHIQEQNLLILGLNSAWQVDHHYISRACIHPDAVSNALTRIRQNPEIYGNCFKFAVWHHPLASSGEDRITDLGFMQRLSQAGFCIAFHGHIHKSETGLYCYDHSSDGRKINIIFAGTFGAPVREWVPGYPLQYNLLKLEDSELTVETRYRRELNGSWKPDAIWTQGPGKNPLPRYKVDLPGSPKHYPDALPVPGYKHKAMKQELEKTRQDLQNARARIEEYKEENVRLQGARKFSEDFLHKLFGGKVKDMKFEQIMERLLAEMEEKGEVSVSVPPTSKNETSGGSKRKRIVFRPVKK